MVPLLRTARLLVRPWTLEPKDLLAAHRIYGDPAVTRYIGGQTMPDLDATRAHMEMRRQRYLRWRCRYGAWAIERLSDRELIGTLLMKPLPGPSSLPTEDIEIGWHLARSAWGQGYATEAARGLMIHARDREGLTVLHVVVDPSNERSLAVVKRLDFTYQGRTRGYYGGLEVEHFRRALPP